MSAVEKRALSSWASSWARWRDRDETGGAQVSEDGALTRIRAPGGRLSLKAALVAGGITTAVYGSMEVLVLLTSTRHGLWWAMFLMAIALGAIVGGATYGMNLEEPVANPADEELVLDDAARTLTAPRASAPVGAPWPVTLKWSEVESVSVEEIPVFSRRLGGATYVVKLARRTYAPRWITLGGWPDGRRAERFRAWLEKRIKLTGALEW